MHWPQQSPDIMNCRLPWFRNRYVGSTTRTQRVLPVCRWKFDGVQVAKMNELLGIDVTGEFCTRGNVRETGTRGAEAWHGRSTVQSRSSPCCDRSKSS